MWTSESTSNLTTLVTTICSLLSIFATIYVLPVVHKDINNLQDEFEADMVDYKIFTDDIWKDLMAIRQIGARQKRQNYGGDIFGTSPPPAGYGQGTPVPKIANAYNPVDIGVGQTTAAILPAPVCECKVTDNKCPPGPPGAPGPAGEDGMPGTNGKKGEAGKDYAVAKNGGQTAAGGYGGGPNAGPTTPQATGIGGYGPISEGVTQCPACPAGPAGPRGALGPPGPKGKQGGKGVPGREGRPGSPGPLGPHGPLGPKGKPGKLGQKGSPGKDGITGGATKPGAKGKVGPVGSPGSKGNPGHPGFQGSVGEPGAPGAPGAPGEGGAIGPAGPQSGPGGPGPDGTYCPCPKQGAGNPAGKVGELNTNKPDNGGAYPGGNNPPTNGPLAVLPTGPPADAGYKGPGPATNGPSALVTSGGPADKGYPAPATSAPQTANTGIAYGLPGGTFGFYRSKFRSLAQA